MVVFQQRPTVYAGKRPSFVFILADRAEFFVDLEVTISITIASIFLGLAGNITTHLPGLF
jgi:hypothetical protein